MKRRWYFFVVLLLPLLAPAQNEEVIADGFGVVQDKDGWSNIREDPRSDGKIIARVDHGELVYFIGSKVNGWVSVAFEQNTGDKTSFGFIHESRLKPLSKFEMIKGRKQGDQGLVFSSKTVNIAIEAGVFDPNGVAITRTGASAGNDGYVSKIDGKEPWGVDGGLPRKKYAKFIVSINGADASPVRAAIEDLFEPSLQLDWVKVYRDPKTGDVYFTTLNSDGAGGYVAALKFSNGSYASRAVFAPF